jgi:glycosyltransferase involved in cell wall biosynthesis
VDRATRLSYDEAVVRDLLRQPDAAAKTEDGDAPLVSVVIPCLNEAATIEACVRRALATLEAESIPGEVIVVDNGSTDDSRALAAAAGARIVEAPERGYGAACRKGFSAAMGQYIVLADGDLTYDFAEIPRFVRELDAGADLVVGDRMDRIEPGAMRSLHRYVGNPVLSGLLNLFFHSGVHDAHCGMRALRRDRLPALNLHAQGMEFSSEMVIQARKARLDIRQISIGYSVRGGVSKLSTFRDGWRHLRLLLVHSPTHLFLFPGAVMVLVGILGIATVVVHLSLFGREWDIHALVAASLLVIVGSQTIAMGVCALAYAAVVLGDRTVWFERLRARTRAEHGLLAGTLTILAGLALGGTVFAIWIHRGFGRLSEVRPAIIAAMLIVIGIQIVFTSFLLALFSLRAGGEDGSR